MLIHAANLTEAYLAFCINVSTFENLMGQKFKYDNSFSVKPTSLQPTKKPNISTQVVTMCHRNDQCSYGKPVTIQHLF